MADSGAGKFNADGLQQDQTDKQSDIEPPPMQEEKNERLPDINNVLFIGKWTMTEFSIHEDQPQH